MNIRRAKEKDIPRLIELLEQVLQIHADIRPDIFIPGTTKYTNEELAEMIKYNALAEKVMNFLMDNAKATTGATTEAAETTESTEAADAEQAEE